MSVQAGALAIIGNLTALPFSNGDLTIDASGQPKPNVSNLNYSTGLNVANSVTYRSAAFRLTDLLMTRISRATISNSELHPPRLTTSHGHKQL